MDSPYVIETRGLTKRFGGLTAVDAVDLSVRRGEIFGLVGPDGAGKTTLLRLLCGAIDTTDGEATVAGFGVTREIEQVREHLGYMPQSFSLYPDLSVRENLEFFADIFGVPAAVRGQRMAELLEFSRLTDFQKRRAEHLSGGMKKKLALACTLMHQPAVVMLDEPTTGVDPVSRRELWRILYNLLRTGVTIVVTTPYMDEAELCNRVGFIMGGRLLVTGTPAELEALPGKAVIELKARPRKAMHAAAAQTPGIDSIQIFGDRLHLLTAQPDAVSASVSEALRSQGADVLTLRTIHPSMEDVFMHLSQRGDAEGEGA